MGDLDHSCLESKPVEQLNPAAAASQPSTDPIGAGGAAAATPWAPGNAERVEQDGRKRHLELVLAGFIKIVGEADADLASNEAHKGRPLPPAKQPAVEVTSAALVNVITTFVQICFGPNSARVDRQAP